MKRRIFGMLWDEWSGATAWSGGVDPARLLVLPSGQAFSVAEIGERRSLCHEGWQ